MKHRILSLVLCAAMLLTLTPPWARANGGVCSSHDSTSNCTVEQVTIEDCYYGKSTAAKHTCKTCGYQWMTAIRPESSTGWPKGQHTYEDKETTSACPGNPWKAKECSKCHHIEMVSNSGTHKWSEWKDSCGNDCIGITEERHCENKDCTVSETRLKQGSVKGHDYPADDGDCTTPILCTRCNNAKEGSVKSHVWSSKWTSNGESHWRACTNPGCKQTSEKDSHNGAPVREYDCSADTVCIVCNYKLASGGSHSWGPWKYFGYGSHVHYCQNENCNQRQTGHCSLDNCEPRTLCTEDYVCALCHQAIKEGQKRHNLGWWIGDEDGHTRECRNKCEYVEEEPHVPGPAREYDCTADTICIVCKYTLEPSAYSAHAFGAWVDAGASGHVRYCVHPNCGGHETKAHTGGTATCSTLAQCAECGAFYGQTDPNNHHGGTAVRNARPAQEGVEGYTGDTYCLGCGEKLASGETIPALPHTHHYGSSWMQDADSHWHECACGDKQDTAPHTFQDGKCTVCGMEEPKPEPENPGEPTPGKPDPADPDPDDPSPEEPVDPDPEEPDEPGEPTPGKPEEPTPTDPDPDPEEPGEPTPGKPDPEKPAPEQPSPEEPTPGNPENPKPADPKPGEPSQPAPSDPAPVPPAPSTPQPSVPSVPSPQPQQPEETEEPEESAAQEPALTQTFSDVPVDNYACEAVTWAVEMGITNGTGGGKFSPADTCTEVQILTMLYRAVGSPNMSGSNAVSETLEGDMRQAVLWAQKIGLIGEDFDPQSPCTRAAAVTFLWKVAGSPMPTEMTEFKDVSADAEYALAVAWAKENLITTGTGGGCFSPDAVCERGQIVTFLFRAKHED